MGWREEGYRASCDGGSWFAARFESWRGHRLFWRIICAWFQAAASEQMRTALFWVITQGAVVNSLIPYGEITTTRCVVTYKKAVLGLFVVFTSPSRGNRL